MQKSDSHFPRSCRLLSGKEFSRVFEKPSRIRCNGFLALHRPGTGTRSRIGLAVAKKKIPHAVDRNRFKRIARESFRTLGPEFNLVDIVIIAYGDAKNLDNTTLFNAFERTWTKIDLFYKK